MMTLKRKIGTEPKSLDNDNGMKTSKVQIVERRKKPLTKNELLVENKALSDKNEQLIKENQQLLQKIKDMENEGIKKAMTKDQDCQTKPDSEYVEISCTECIFLASCEDELNYHMGEEHDKDYISYFETDFPCSVCDRWCQSEKDLNWHMKIHHCKRVKFCGFECNFCDKNIDEITKEKQIESMDVEESNAKSDTDSDGIFKCDSCDMSFHTKQDLMIHRKKEHIEKVPTCWNYIEGNCLWENSCWFNHTDNSSTLEKCNICGQKFKTIKDLKLHKKNQHPINVPLCRAEESNT